MKKIILLIVLVVVAILAEAQQKDKKFQRSDIEVGFGVTFGADNYRYDNGGMGPQIKLEYRYNFKSIPIDAGFQIARSVLIISDDLDDNNKVDTDFIVVNYRFYKKQNIGLYTGVGGGLVNSDYMGAAMRVGAKLFNHINLCLEYKFINEEDSHASVNLGFFF
ncbi:hypothetical protein [Mangrovibacterium lignilyticum]|uniref:hypothetical protein n=1 Tax=Mangrovibacterium lignilyticum TaxID=2668052 RepID=UPI0013D366C0|nr:hypothetical protein [Mangrovibacterium lignilyticum]